MEGIFGIGIPEILLVFVLALVLLGPQDMVATARKMGRWVNKLVRSPIWREIMSTSQELRDLPTKFVREAGLEETVKELKQTSQDVRSELKETTNQVSTELKQTQQEVKEETQAAIGQAKGDFQAAVGQAKDDFQESIRPEAPPPPEPESKSSKPDEFEI